LSIFINTKYEENLKNHSGKKTVHIQMVFQKSYFQTPSYSSSI
jgi:hypothetical protein